MSVAETVQGSVGDGCLRGQKRSAPHDEELSGDEVLPHSACQSCRKRKARCSRQQPCRQCQRLNVECLYDEKRQKPGMRSGAIESLNQRLTALEQMFLGQGILLRPLLDQAFKTAEIPAAKIDDLASQTDGLRRHLMSTAQNHSPPDVVQGNVSLQSPQYHDSSPPSIKSTPYSIRDSILPPADVVDRLIEIYFQQVHPWIPVLHTSSFKARMKDPTQRERLSTVLHAITSVCLRLDDSEYVRSLPDLKGYCLSCRHIVVLRSMETFSVQNLQALVIIAFDVIGSGRGPSAWSVVGSMARTVEQLQLSVEENDDKLAETTRQPLFSRAVFLKPPETWIEAEERRRVFWTVFLMDRFCSVATGWNNSITGADVRRRLPCEGALWQAGNCVPTPYFGIVERSSTSATGGANLTPSSERQAVDEEEVNNIGGFAFCVEATESLNLVTTFFLRQAVNFNNPREIQIWLLKFRELDTRLVRWRLFLPSRWGDASVPNSEGNMDQNLSLAHITHNTAVIQLHQEIAYPSPQWRLVSISLPSSTSAETCVTAATEIRTIAQKYLQMSTGLVHPQLSFCLFVAGRVLLAHAAYYKETIASTFDDILSCLHQISQRWSQTSSAASGDNLAYPFAIRLQQARAGLQEDTIPQQQLLFDMRKPVYPDAIRDSRPVTRRGSVEAIAPGDQQLKVSDATRTPQGEFALEPMSLAFPPLPLSFQQYPDSRQTTAVGGQIGGPLMMNDLAQNHLVSPTPTDIFGDMANIFDSPFQGMLRVSTYEG